MLINKIKKCCIYLMCMVLVCSRVELSYASIEAGGSKGYVSKAEFNSVLADVNAKLFSYERTFKIEEEIDTYLSSNYYKKSEVDVLLGNKQNDIMNITGSAGQVLKRNATNNGLEFADIDGDYYEKTEIDTMLGNKQNDVMNITGSAGQVLKRNAANNGLEFVDISGDYYEKIDVDTMLGDKQNNILSNITGSANQYLKRNSSNNGLEFGSITAGNLYMHNIEIYQTSSKLITTQVINNVSTAYTKDTFTQYLYSQGYTSYGKHLMCNGAYNISTSQRGVVVGIYATSTTSLSIYCSVIGVCDNISGGSFTDKVIQIR